MKRLSIALGLAVGFIETGAWGQSAGLSNIQAIQSAEITQLKQEIKSLTESLKATRADLQLKVDTLSAELAVVRSAAATAQSSANTAASAAGTAQSTADRAINASAAAQSTANAAYANTANPVVMVGAETGRRWPSCPPGYHWIGGFNNDTTVAYPEMNRWHTNYAWLCARD
jgi:hypothetical protein